MEGSDGALLNSLHIYHLYIYSPEECKTHTHEPNPQKPFSGQVLFPTIQRPLTTGVRGKQILLSARFVTRISTGMKSHMHSSALSSWLL